MSRYEELSVGTLLTTGDSLVVTGVGTKEGTEVLQKAFTVTEGMMSFIRQSFPS